MLCPEFPLNTFPFVLLVLKTGQYDKARERLLESISVLKDIHDDPGADIERAAAYEALGRVETETHDIEMAGEMFSKALAIVCKVNILHRERSKSDHRHLGIDPLGATADELKEKVIKMNEPKMANPQEMEDRLKDRLAKLEKGLMSHYDSRGYARNLYENAASSGIDDGVMERSCDIDDHIIQFSLVPALGHPGKSTAPILTSGISSKRGIPLIAHAFEKEFSNHSRKDYFTFCGKDAVSWLVQEGHASSRDEATHIALKLANEHFLIKQFGKVGALSEFHDDNQVVYCIMPENKRELEARLFEIEDFKKGKNADTRCELAKSKSHFEAAARKAVELYGENHECMGLVYEALADVCQKLWNNELAKHYYNLALRIFQDRYGLQCLIVARVKESQGDLCKQMGLDAAAKQYYKASMDIRDSILDNDGNRPDVLLTEILVKNSLLGVAQIKLGYYQNNYFEMAKELFWRIVKEARKEPSHNSNILPFALLSIGNIDYKQHKSASAISVYLSLLKVYIELKNRVNIARTLSNLGTAYLQLNDLNSANDCFDRGLAVLQSSIEPPLLLVASLLRKLGSVLARKKNFVKAKRNYVKALSIKKRVLNNDSHPEVLFIEHEIALLHCKQRRFNEALLSLERLIEEQRHVASDSTWLAKLLLDSCGARLQRKHEGDRQKANQYLNEFLILLKDTKISPDHPYMRQYQKLHKIIS